MAHGTFEKRFDRALAELAAIPDAADRLDAVRRSRQTLEELEAAAVREARAAGVTWKTIGTIYGLSKQGAQQRFRPPTAPPAL
jgi:predicted CoA-binding protein